MNEYQDNVRLKKSSYDRKLAILTQKIKNYHRFKNRKDRKPSLVFPSVSRQKIYAQEQGQENLDENTDQTKTSVSFKNTFVKLFIQKLKQNRFNSTYNNHADLSRINGIIERIDTICIQTQPIGPKGWKAPIPIKLIIPIMTLLTIIIIQILATFQCLFVDYQEFNSTNTAIITIKYVLLATSILRIISKIIFVKTVLGEKSEYISSIFFDYICHFQFYMDAIMLISIILLIAYPQSTAAGVFGCFLMILNIVYFENMNKQIDIFVINNNIKKQMLALFRLILANFLVSHFITILLIIFALFEETNWMQKYNIQDEIWWSKYIYGLYYATTIISTVGFGDFSISNRDQAILITFIMLFGCVILSYNISKVSHIIASLNEVPDRVRNQLSVLDRLAMIAQIDQNLHHTIAEYIINVGKIEHAFEVAERHQLIQTLPSQLKQEFIEQSSRNFCSKLPFFFMLKIQTKKRICQLLKTEVVSPNQYLTHKRQGLKKIIILRKGTVGLSYKKKGSNLNGRIVDSIQIKNETQKPQLLNTNLLVRGKKLPYNIICLKYCIVALLQFQLFVSSLKESQQDYELYHQTIDEAFFKVKEWNRKKCSFCNLHHSMFVCSKMHYIPYRNLVYIRHQKKIGESQQREKINYQREKIWYSKCSSLKFWKKLFVPFEKVFDTNIQKSQLLRITKTNIKEQKESQSNKWKEFQQLFILKQYYDSLQLNVDVIQNFRYYFHRDNANNLIQRPLSRNNKSTIQIERFEQFQISQFMRYQ